MQKIKTIYKRNPDNMRHLLPEITSGCEWVFNDAEGVPTRKYDGTCCMFDGERWWARREVKPGKQAPENFQPIETDEMTGKTVGWEPMEQTGFAKWHQQAIDALIGPSEQSFKQGTYELCGPKINKNPEKYINHILIFHAEAEDLSDLVRVPSDNPPQRGFDELREKLIEMGHEGIVWHHPDGRMAKIKRKDFI